MFELNCFIGVEVHADDHYESFNAACKIVFLFLRDIFSLANFLSVDSDIESKSLNNTFLIIIEILFLICFPVLRTLNQKFSINVELRKQDFFSREIISHHSRFVNKELIH